MNYDIKITGNGTPEQLAHELLDIVRELQVAHVYENDEVTDGDRESSFICATITKQY